MENTGKKDKGETRAFYKCKIINPLFVAKKKVVTEKKLIPHKEVVVKSRAYGEHTRAARGSKTPVGLNKAFAAHNAKTVAVNSTAKRVHDLLKHCGKLFKEKMLWQVTLGRMRKSAYEDMMGMLQTLKGMELNSRYPLERFVHPRVMDVKWDKKGCEMVMSKGVSALEGCGHRVFL